jgi:hypothetical protein
MRICDAGDITCRETTMPRISAVAALLAATIGLAGCAETRFQADVTRFHLSLPATRGTLAVIAADPAMAQSLQFRSDAAAVSEQFRALGYVPADAAAAETLAVLTVKQETRAGPPRPPKFSIGIGGGSYGRGGGFGTGVTLPVGQSAPTQLRTTELLMQLRRHSDQTVMWEGRASTIDAGTITGGGGPAVVPQLATALLDGFPGVSGKTVRWRGK